MTYKLTVLYYVKMCLLYKKRTVYKYKFYIQVYVEILAPNAILGCFFVEFCGAVPGTTPFWRRLTLPGAAALPRTTLPSYARAGVLWWYGVPSMSSTLLRLPGFLLPSSAIPVRVALALRFVSDVLRVLVAGRAPK